MERRTLVVTSASLVVTGALLVVTMFAIRITLELIYFIPAHAVIVL